MTLSPEVIEMAEKELDVKSHYIPADEVTANHILYKLFIDGTKWKGVPKLIYYIVMDNTFGMSWEKDKDGFLGRRIILKVQNDK